MSEVQGLSCPPDGLTALGQARWWLREPEKLLFALRNGCITPEVMSACEQVAKGNDLAFKVIDTKKIKGLSNEERSLIFNVLTDGVEWTGQAQGAPSKALSDLRMAYSIKDVTDSNERSKLLHDAIIAESGCMSEDDSIYRRAKRIEAFWASVITFPPIVIDSFLNNVHPDDEPMTQKQIMSILSFMAAFQH